MYLLTVYKNYNNKKISNHWETVNLVHHLLCYVIILTPETCRLVRPLQGYWIIRTNLLVWPLDEKRCLDVHRGYTLF